MVLKFCGMRRPFLLASPDYTQNPAKGVNECKRLFSRFNFGIARHHGSGNVLACNFRNLGAAVTQF